MVIEVVPRAPCRGGEFTQHRAYLFYHPCLGKHAEEALYMHVQKLFFEFMSRRAVWLKFKF